MAISSITNEQEHAAVLDAIEMLLEAEPGTAEATKLAELTKLIDEYEDIHYQWFTEFEE